VTELRKVTGPSSRTDRNIWRLVAIVVVAILIAVIKPWGDGERAPTTGVARSEPSPSPSTEITVRGNGLSDFLTFGTREPPPGWELWPAGNLASFYFAMRIDIDPKQAEGSARPSTSPSPSPSTSSSSDGPSGLAPVPADWPTIRIPAGSTLDLVGINHPLGYTIDLVSFEALDADQRQPIHAVLATSPWPDHFTIFGVATGATDVLGPWPTGHYRLSVRVGPDASERDLEIVVEQSTRPSASPSLSPSSP
jgi:hypothetical protein